MMMMMMRVGWETRLRFVERGIEVRLVILGEGSSKVEWGSEVEASPKRHHF